MNGDQIKAVIASYWRYVRQCPGEGTIGGEMPKGITVIEVLLIIAILAILAAVVVPRVLGYW